MMNMDKGQVRVNIKARARELLRGNMLHIWLVLAIPMLISFMFSMMQQTVSVAMMGLPALLEGVEGEFSGVLMLISLVSSFAHMLVSTPLIFGSLDWFMEFAKGNRMPFTYIFKYFESGKLFLKTYAVIFSVFFRMLPISILAGIAVAIPMTGYLGYVGFVRHTSEINMTGIASIALAAYMIVLTILLSVYMYRYSMVNYYMVQNPEARTKDIVHRSMQAMKSHMWEFWIFQMSFIGLGILAVVTCGIYFIYLLPYTTVANVLFNMYVDDFHRVRMGEELAPLPYDKSMEEPRNPDEIL